MRPLALALVLVIVALAVPAAQQAPRPAFRSDVNLVVVDVIVRDRTGAIVRGLTASDFEIREDNKAQQVASFNVEEVTTTVPAGQVVPQVLTAGIGSSDDKAAATAAPSPRSEPVTREDLAGRRLIVLLFDLSSMQPEELERAGRAAVEYVDKQMVDADLVAVATIDTTLKVVADFTLERHGEHRVGIRIGREMKAA